MTRRPFNESVRIVVPMVKAGMMQKDIAAKIGKSEQVVYKYVIRARELGLLPPKAKQKAPGILTGFSAGRLQVELGKLDPKIQLWIAKNLPQGATLAEFVAACIVDQYHDEVEK